MAGSIKGIIIEIGGDTSGLQKALNKVNSATSSLSRELRGINSLLKLDPENTELLSQKQIVLNQEIGKTEEKLKVLRKTQEEADKTLAEGGEISQENYRAIQREIVKTENELKQLKLEASNWTKAGRKLEEFGNKVISVSSKVENLGNKLTKTFTTGIVAAGSIAIKSAMDFETAFTGVEKTVDGTAEQMQNLKEGIKKLATEIPSSTTEISAVAEAAGQLGIQTDNILDFSKAMIDLGNSTNLTADEAATQLARFANITQMSQKDFGKLGSSIVDLGNNFATTEAEIVAMAMRLAGAGKQVGFSEGQILGLATALSSVGIEAEMGGSAISKAMVKMQNAVEMGGNKLNIVLKKTGLTLRELELMSANDSMGFKELSQSIGMTSTEVKQLINAGTNLEDFANISGMSAEKFKKAWKKDASEALTAFIKGLGNAESKGKSAITMLSEMGLTEVRLRDSLLRAANAGTLLNDAIKTGTEAFEDNTALTKEANKRYATLESRFKTTLNKTNNLAINFSKKLTPSINKLLDKVDNFIGRLDNLSEEETENVIKIGLMVAAAGPLVKILGKIGTVSGTVVKGVGTLSQAIGVLKTGATSTNLSVNNLAKGIGALTSPAGLLITAFAGLTTAAVIYETHQQEMLGNSVKIKKAIDNEVESRNQLIEKQEEKLNSDLSEIDRTQELYNELKNITTENGKIKAGYENRANYITKQLSQALGTEIKINNGVVQAYKEIQKEVDKTILKKKAEAIVAAGEEAYNTALEKRAQAYDTLAELQEKYQEASLKSKNYDTQARLAAASLSKQIQEQQKLLDGYNTDIANYDKNYSLLIKNTTESLSELIRNNEIGVKKQTDDTYDEITSQISYYSKLVKDYKKLKEEQLQKGNEYRADEYEQQEKSNQKQLEQLSKQLSEITTTTNINEPAIQEAWKNIADNSSDAFFNIISKMPKTTQSKLLEIAGVVNRDTNTRNSINSLSVDMSDIYKMGISGTVPSTKNNLKDVQNTIKKDTTVEKATEELAEKAKSGFNNNVDGTKWGSDLTKEVSSSMTSSKSKGLISGAAKKVAGWISSYLHFSVPDRGPLSDMDKSMPDMIQLMAQGIDKNKSKLEKATEKLAGILNNKLTQQSILKMSDFEKMQGHINSQVIDSTKTVFTTPQIVFNIQELDEAKLQQCFNYVNKKFGSKY